MVPTYLLLTLAILGLWIGAARPAPAARDAFWIVPFLASLGTALAADIVQPIGLMWIAAFAVSVYIFSHLPRAGWPRVAAGAAIVALTAGLMAHRLPGFNNPRVIAWRQFSADALPFRLHLNFDKTLVGLFLLGWCHGRISRAAEWRAALRSMAPRAAVIIAVLLALSLASGYVRFDPKFPPEAWLWLWANLCLTCMAEEAIFRGFIQAQLARKWSDLPHGKWLALVIAAGLFGLAHFGGGLAYVALSTLAGLGYGWVYLRTGKIEASILTHFAVNAVHFLGFTYPALQPA